MAITGQAKRRRIVINADAYIGSATSNVPVLVKFNSTSHVDLFGTGDDKDSVWFSSDASGQTTLYHEGVVFDSTDAIFYVKVDLSSTADTVIYFWYGTPTITGTESKTNVWTNGKAIWHLEGTADSMGTYTLTFTNASNTSGQVGTCYDFTGSGSSATFTTITLSASTNYTIMSWVYLDSLTNAYIIGYSSASGCYVYVGGSNQNPYHSPDTSNNFVTFGQSSSTSSWNLWSIVRTGTGNSCKGYKNATEGSPSYSGTLRDSPTFLKLANAAAAGYALNGKLDEF